MFGGDSLSEDSFDSNPAATDIDRNPALGPSPASAKSAIIAFEDPSCLVCRRFDEQTFPKLRSNLIDSGKTAFLYRAYPHVREWAKSGVNILYATNARSSDAFWKLNEHFYKNQDSVTTDTVYSFSKKFLQAQTSVDPDAVISEAKNEKSGGLIDADTAARKEANVSGTPTFFLFRDGEFATMVTGSQDYSVFVNALL